MPSSYKRDTSITARQSAVRSQTPPVKINETCMKMDKYKGTLCIDVKGKNEAICAPKSTWCDFADKEKLGFTQGKKILAIVVSIAIVLIGGFTLLILLTMLLGDLANNMTLFTIIWGASTAIAVYGAYRYYKWASNKACTNLPSEKLIEFINPASVETTSPLYMKMNKKGKICIPKK